jgi:hypothetical protein
MTDWVSEERPIPDDIGTPALEERLSVLKGFSVADHLDDRSLAALMEAARGGIGDPSV